MRVFILLVLFFAVSPVFAQQFNGRVVDENKTGIPGVSVRVLGKSLYAKSDFNGNFKIDQVSLGDSLSFNMLGFASRNVVFSRDIESEIVLQEAYISLEGVEVKPEMDAMQVFADVNVQVSPVNSSQDLLRMVPGLFIGQHAGGGKAEQIFLRGFDIDHGTDLNITVDGMPVNMVSHAHGQGYSDLHFVIPETVEGIEFSKGSYNADQGNFATAGSVAFKTKERLDKSSVSLEYGSFNYKRALGMFNLVKDRTSKNQAYIGSEYVYSDGPFVSPQNFNRFNVMGKWNRQISSTAKLVVAGSYFGSKWDASGQIPERAVASGLITRFGAIDDTEGGNTSRTNASVTYYKSFGNNTTLETRAFYTNYDFLLFSNFTFFAVDPVNGDQIKQAENRNLFGFETSFSKELYGFTLNANGGVRSDFIRDNELTRTENKTEVLNRIYYGNIDETNTYLNLNTEFKFGKLSVIPGLRFDHFYFNYNDKLTEDGTGNTEQSVLVSPKLSFIVQPNPETQFFLKTGTGYHSNDTRAVVFRNNSQVLPRSYGADLGTVLKLNKRVLLNATLWALNLDQEFVYVGDEGIVEPSGKTNRLGADLGLRAQITDRLFFDSDVTYSYARSKDEPAGENYIPLAPAFTFTGGLAISNWKGFSGGIKSRILGNRPANEDYSITAEGYFITDANVNYDFKKFRVGLNIQNLFNSSWNETQFATTSKLFNEANPVEEIHFTPGTPFALRASVSLRF